MKILHIYSSMGVIILALVCIGCTSSSGGEAMDISDLLPRDNEIGDFTMDDTYTAGDADDLSTVINGAAYGYVPFGLVEGVLANYISGSDTVHVRILKLESTSKAESLYKDQTSFMSTSIAPDEFDRAEADEAVIDTSSTASRMLHFTKAEYYIRLSITKGDKSGEATIQSFGIAVAENIDTAAN